MLKFTNNKLSIEKKYSAINRKKTSKHFPSSTREWKNSLYMFNKNNINQIPSSDLEFISIIKSYFLLFNRNIEKNIRSKRLSIRFRKSSSNKIYVSHGEFKHTNNKVAINLYIFNRQSKNYTAAMKIIKTRMKMKKANLMQHKRYKILLEEIFRLYYSEWDRFSQGSMSYHYKPGSLYTDSCIERNSIERNINTKLKNYSKKILDNEISKRLLYWYYKQISFVNKSKFSYLYLQFLKQQLTKLYNKQIELNIISLKRFYLNSDILSESITKKITKNRKKTLRYLTKLKNKIRVKSKNYVLRRSLINNKLQTTNLIKSTNTLRKFIFKNLKYKYVTGFRLEAKGRITKRYTASRSLLKVKYKGNLIDLDSSIKGLSTVFIIGNLKSNLQYTKLSSKSRIGSFGIKGWVSGY